MLVRETSGLLVWSPTNVWPASWLVANKHAVASVVLRVALVGRWSRIGANGSSRWLPRTFSR